MRIAYGFYNADSGEILINDQPVAVRTPHDAIATGSDGPPAFYACGHDDRRENIVLGQRRAVP
jgi:ABC-type uncharacterized transport system ATPase subunit